MMQCGGRPWTLGYGKESCLGEHGLTPDRFDNYEVFQCRILNDIGAGCRSVDP